MMRPFHSRWCNVVAHAGIWLAASVAAQCAPTESAAATAATTASTAKQAPAASTQTLTFQVGDFHLGLRRDTQTLASLSPKSQPAFDFVPAGREAQRQGDGYVHVGDL